MKANMALLLAGLMLVASCRKKDVPPVDNTPGDNTKETGQVTLSFKNMVGSVPLILHSEQYQNANGDSFSVSSYVYYISNISLISATDTFAEPESYYLINESIPTSRTFTITDIPKGTYTKLRFLIGVDEERNTSGTQSGALDPMHGMFWTWNTGYIMAKLEGHSPRSNTVDNTLIFHIGGFSGPHSALRWVTLTLPTPLVVTAEGKPAIYLNCDVLEWFKEPNVIDFSELSLIMNTSEQSAAIADNYADMFTIDFVEHKE
jgi:hypothetical protein